MKKVTHLLKYLRKLGFKLNEIPLISQLLETQELKASFVMCVGNIFVSPFSTIIMRHKTPASRK